MISVAMATYNGEKYLREQLDSILLQTARDFELVVCDDNSTDKTFLILQEYQKRDGRIRIFKNDSNLGFLRNFEKAFSLCRGDFIAPSDQDDIWLPNHLEILRSAIDTGGGYNLVGGGNFLIDENGISFGAVQKNFSKKIPSWKKSRRSRENVLLSLLDANYLQGAAMLFRKELLDAALPFPKGTVYHDFALAICACFTEKGVLRIDEPILYWRRHKGSTTFSESDFVMAKCGPRSFIQKITLFFSKNELEFHHKMFVKACKTAFKDRISLLVYAQNPRQKKLMKSAIRYKRQCACGNALSLLFFLKTYFRIHKKTNLIKFAYHLLYRIWVM